MSANQSHTPDGHGIMLYSGETVLVFTREVNLSFKSAPEHFFKGKKIGNLYLTTHRIIFLATDGGELKSLAMPFICIDNVQLEQPIFGANYLEGIVSAQPGGNFEGEVVWKLSFNRGGCIDFGKALKQAVSLVQPTRPATAPPPYVPPANSIYAAPPIYSAPQVINGFQAPTHVFTERPDQGTLFAFDQPPPYSGISDPHPQMYPDLNDQSTPYPSGSQPSAPLPDYEQATKLPQKKFN